MATNRLTRGDVCVEASTVSPDEAMRIFKRHGFIQLTGAVPLPEIERLRNSVTKYFHEMETDLGEFRQSISFFRAINDSESGPERKAYRQLLECIADLQQTAPTINRFCLFFGHAGHMRLPHARWVNRNGKGNIAFHQDSTSFVHSPGMDRRINNFARLQTMWIPLDPLDGTRPSVEYVSGWTETVYDHIAGGDMVERNLPESIRGNPRYVVEAELGDVVVHDQNAVHGTYVTPEMTNSRRNIEIRDFLSD